MLKKKKKKNLKIYPKKIKNIINLIQNQEK